MRLKQQVKDVLIPVIIHHQVKIFLFLLNKSNHSFNKGGEVTTQILNSLVEKKKG